MSTYICKKCGNTAEKKPCKKGETNGLGHWHCRRCGKTKVSRQ